MIGTATRAAATTTRMRANDVGFFNGGVDSLSAAGYSPVAGPSAVAGGGVSAEPPSTPPRTAHFGMRLTRGVSKTVGMRPSRISVRISCLSTRITCATSSGVINSGHVDASCRSMTTAPSPLRFTTGQAWWKRGTMPKTKWTSTEGQVTD